MGFEPTNGGFADHSWFSILLVRLAFTPAHLPDFGPSLGLTVPKLFPTCPAAPPQNLQGLLEKFVNGIDAEFLGV